MKKFFLIVCALTFLSGCGQENSAERKKELRRRDQNIANKVVPAITYIKDPRTGICFAYYWGGGHSGGPALAAVPEEKIPPHLIAEAVLID